MQENSYLSFTYKEKISIKGNFYNRLDNVLNKKNSSSMIKNDKKEGLTYIEYYIRDKILDKEESFKLSFTFKVETEKKLPIIKSNDNIQLVETTLNLYSENRTLNDYHLENYIKNIYHEILLSEYNESLEKYTIRIYSNLFNSYQIKGEYQVTHNGKKVMIKPFHLKDRQEPLTEHIIFFDIETKAVNIEHARSIAYNDAKDIHALLSILLDVGFELINSEFKNFIILNQNEFTLKRHRTGFFDSDLNLVVKDNMNGLKHILDTNDINNFFAGKVSLKMEASDEYFSFETTTKENLKNTFINHKIKKNKSINGNYCDNIKKEKHFENTPIEIPKVIRNFFRNFHTLEKNKKDAFLACSRMYNISLTSGKYEPTLRISYLICAIEALSEYQKTNKDAKKGFSQFLIKYAPKDFNKKLTDYFYSLRSAHFHGGNFSFNEFMMNLQVESDFLNKSKVDDFIEFYNIIRATIINWVEKEILEEKKS